MSHAPEPGQRWKCICAYAGGSFAGWQSQARGQAIQDLIEARLAELFGKAIRIHGSGRTDAGVHAKGQVFHFDAVWKHGSEKLVSALRAGLPSAIQIVSAKPVKGDFHSRYDAKSKRYIYHIRLGQADPFTAPYVWSVRKELAFAPMAKAARLLVGHHDFAAFSAINGTEREDTIRNLTRLDVRRKGRDLRIIAEADGFLYKMVRSLVGALVAVGEGKLEVERIPALLKQGRRNSEVQTAPAQGLFLMKVYY